MHINNKFLIVSAPRCGTHMLKSTLEQHHSVQIKDEILNPHSTHMSNQYSPKFVATRKGFEGPEEMAKGFIIHRIHQPDSIWKAFYKQPDIKIIYLARKDKLRQYLSLNLAMKRNTWQYYDNFTEATKIVFDIKDFIHHTEWFKTNYNIKLAAFRKYKHRILELYYEDLVDNFDNTYASVCNFLNVEHIELKPTTTKVDSRPIKDIIINYEDAMLQLKNNGYNYE